MPAGIDEVDSSNNTGTDDDTVLGAESDVSVTKTLVGAVVNSTNPDVTDLSYQIIVTNEGPSVANGIDVDDSIGDPNFNQGSATWNCSIQGTGSCAEIE